MASIYEGLDFMLLKRKLADCLQELGLWWWYEFPVCIYDEKKRPRVWTPDFYIPKLGMFIEVCGQKDRVMNIEKKDSKKMVIT